MELHLSLRWRSLTIHRIFVLSERDFMWLLNELDRTQGDYLCAISNKFTSLFDGAAADRSILLWEESRDLEIRECAKEIEKNCNMSIHLPTLSH